jgi:asparagine synthase (glutamine-hydrolysing)
MLATLGIASFEFPVADVPLWLDDYGIISWIEASHYMRDTLLRDSDQMSMAVGLELRVPLLDHELVEYILSLPSSTKRHTGSGKALMVAACKDLLPPEVYERKKWDLAYQCVVG